MKCEKFSLYLKQGIVRSVYLLFHTFVEYTMHGVSLNVKFVLSAVTNHVAQCHVNIS